MTEKIDLLEEELGITGPEPIEFAVGKFTLAVRRSHTGLQVAQWQAIEVKRTTAKEAVLTGEGTDAEKLEKLAGVGNTYLRDMLEFLAEKPTTKRDIDGICALLENASSQLIAKVTGRIFKESGLFTEDGKHVPFLESSETESNTDA